MTKTAPVPEGAKMITIASRQGTTLRLVTGQSIDLADFPEDRRKTWRKNTSRVVQIEGEWYPVQFATSNYYIFPWDLNGFSRP